MNESAYHVTLIGDLEEWLHHSLFVYSRYQEWRPNYDFIEVDDAVYQVRNIPALTFGMGYRLNDYLTFKVEYTDTFGRRTEEPEFQDQVGIAQLVGSF